MPTTWTYHLRISGGTLSVVVIAERRYGPCRLSDDNSKVNFYKLLQWDFCELGALTVAHQTASKHQSSVILGSIQLLLLLLLQYMFIKQFFIMPDIEAIAGVHLNFQQETSCTVRTCSQTGCQRTCTPSPETSHCNDSWPLHWQRPP